MLCYVKRFELAFTRTESKIARLTNMHKIVNNIIRVNIPEYIARPTRVTCSYHSSKFRNIVMNSNIYL